MGRLEHPQRALRVLKHRTNEERNAIAFARSQNRNEAHHVRHRRPRVVVDSPLQFEHRHLGQAMIEGLVGLRDGRRCRQRPPEVIVGGSIEKLGAGLQRVRHLGEEWIGLLADAHRITVLRRASGIQGHWEPRLPDGRVVPIDGRLGTIGWAKADRPAGHPPGAPSSTSLCQREARWPLAKVRLTRTQERKDECGTQRA